MTSRHARLGSSGVLAGLAAMALLVSSVACAGTRLPAARTDPGAAAPPFPRFAHDAPTAIRLSNRGVWLLQKSRPNEALLLFRMALMIDQEVRPPDHPDSAIRLNNIGVALQSLGKPGEALAYYRWALTIDERTYGNTHPDVALRLHNIGAALAAQGKGDEAMAYLLRASAVREALLAQNQRGARGDGDGVYPKTAVPAPAKQETGPLQRAGTQSVSPRR